MIAMVVMRVVMPMIVIIMVFVSVHVRMRAVLMDMKVLRRRIQDIFMRMRVSIRGTRL
jgi:hypothetical protein